MSTKGYTETRINRALMDVIMVGFERITLDSVKKKKQSILKLYRELPERDNNFYDAISLGTSDTKKVEYRLSTWLTKLRTLVR